MMSAAAHTTMNAAATKKTENDITENEKGWDRPEAEAWRPQKPIVAQHENDVTNELNDAENVSKGGADFTVPGISKKEKNWR